MCSVWGINVPTKQEDIIFKDRFDGVWIFTSGLDMGFLGAEVVIIMDVSLAQHVSKIYKVSGQLLSVKLLFKNKLSVSILGLYAGASSVVVNKSSFVILGGDFNKDGFCRCASFKKCLDLGLVNFLVGSPAVKKHTWANSRCVIKTIDYVLVSSNLVNAIVNCNVSKVSEHFDPDH
ncbi:hypothetical protein G9A89_006543 [Geosiphon pyriformis]|nr:hypothetical protein G9A89_006543 [Geosiphon pyriformis]